jgi:hypothetical protein
VGTYVCTVHDQSPGVSILLGLHTHLWKVATTYIWKHAELQLEQHVKDMRHIQQSHGTRVIC